MSMSPIKFFTLNCRGLNACIKSKRILSQIIATRADIIFFAKIHVKKDRGYVFQMPKYPLQVQALDSSKARGVAILLSAHIQVTIENQMADPEGRFFFIM